MEKILKLISFICIKLYNFECIDRLRYNTHHIKNKKNYIIKKNIVFYSLSFILNIKFYKCQIKISL